MITWIITVIISWLLFRIAIKLHNTRLYEISVIQLIFCIVLSLIPVLNIIFSILYVIIAFCMSRGKTAREWVELIFMTNVDWKNWFKDKK
jgi:hypothetical protein